MVINQSNRYLFRVSFTLPVPNVWVRKSYDLRGFNQTHNASMFHLSAKHFLYRYVSPSLAGHSYRVNAG